MSELSDIAALEGIDSLFIGPLDLSFALGVPEDMDSPVFTEAFAEVVKDGHAHNLSVGIPYLGSGTHPLYAGAGN
jgi:2-dehydro-3-deoxyglucarate aldolase/4-hydroxy-2-oxoheptanedioate aldolase